MRVDPSDVAAAASTPTADECKSPESAEHERIRPRLGDRWRESPVQLTHGAAVALQQILAVAETVRPGQAVCRRIRVENNDSIAQGATAVFDHGPEGAEGPGTCHVKSKVCKRPPADVVIWK